MATYNGARFIRQQIDSIVSQLKADDELVISDDGSTDDTVSIILSYNDKRLILVNTDRSSGTPAKNFEKTIHHCTGDLIFLADQDDVWMQHKVVTMLKFLEKYDLVLSDCLVINEQNQILLNSFFAQQKSRRGFTQNLIRNSYMGCCMAFKRKVLQHILPFPQGLRIHDQWIGLIAEKNYNVFFIEEPLVQYRRHDKNYSLTGEKSTRNFFDKVNHRMKILYNLYTR
jgi:glycosyltransferase involved in cell wall biosynthesis